MTGVKSGSELFTDGGAGPVIGVGRNGRGCIDTSGTGAAVPAWHGSGSAGDTGVMRSGGGGRSCTGTGRRGEGVRGRPDSAINRPKLPWRDSEPATTAAPAPAGGCEGPAPALGPRDGKAAASLSVSCMLVTVRCSASSASSKATKRASSSCRASTAHKSVPSSSNSRSTSTASWHVSRVATHMFFARAAFTIAAGQSVPSSLTKDVASVMKSRTAAKIQIIMHDDSTRMTNTSRIVTRQVIA